MSDSSSEKPWIAAWAARDRLIAGIKELAERDAANTWMLAEGRRSRHVWQLAARDHQELDQLHRLRLLRSYVDIVEETEQQLQAAVGAARAAGASWYDIGRVTGVTQQAAHKRWAAKVKSTEGS